MKNSQNKGGISIIGVLLLGLIVILVLSYFHISIRAVVESPQTQDNLNYVGGGTVNLWQNYLREPATYLWNNVWLPYFWRPFIANMEAIRAGRGIDIQNSAPTVNFGTQ